MVGLVSLGCSKNLVDSEAMLGRMVAAGFHITNDPSGADVLIVNTCGFITGAKRESIDAILEMAAYKDSGRCRALVVAGCLAQRYRNDLIVEVPEIDAIIGVREVDRIVEAVDLALSGRRVENLPESAGSSGDSPEFDPAAGTPRTRPRVGLTPQYTAYLRIADGCSNRCAYCAIPSIRGDLRSRPLQELISEARALAESGVRELVVVAQDCTVYGLDIYGKPSLHALIRELARTDGLEWVRLMYCYPSRVSDDLIEVMASEPRACHYIDIPAQHASARVLKSMNRSHDGETVLRTVEKLRKAMPDIAVRTTLMVGFPGETEEDFETLLAFLRSARFDRAGVFEYSREEGTPAASLPGQVDRRIKRERYHRAMSLQNRISGEINEGLIGKTIKVLLERQAPPDRRGAPRWIGRSWRDAPEVDGVVRVTGVIAGAAEGCFVNATVTRASAYDLYAVIV
ncbi:MAG: 30S ribosomal protein S12 methylthiotransferase RimO [Firmicutes bacterium]|nr:30S ribosomal protein S12 methylthiotransferase RimO [Bacillota bacterium]